MYIYFLTFKIKRLATNNKKIFMKVFLMLCCTYKYTAYGWHIKYILYIYIIYQVSKAHRCFRLRICTRRAREGSSSDWVRWMCLSRLQKQSTGTFAFVYSNMHISLIVENIPSRAMINKCLILYHFHKLLQIRLSTILGNIFTWSTCVCTSAQHY